jgi:hypothetical protein
MEDLEAFAMLMEVDTRQDSVRLTGRVIELDDTIGYGYCASRERAYEHLEVTAASYEYDHQRRPISYWELHYKNVYRLGLQDAEIMVKTLRSLERKLESAADKYGRPETFGMYVQRVCEALKIPRLAWYTQAEGLKITSPYIGAHQIDHLVETWVTQAA